jgi:uncharacterized membrane protein
VSGSPALGLGLALGSTLALDVGFLLQQHAASALPELSLRRPLASARSLFAAPVWLAGFVTGVAGWGLYFAALTQAPLSVVQTVAAGGLALLVPLAAAAARRRPSRREWWGAAIASAGLAALALSLAGTSTSAPAAVPTLRVALAGVAVVVAVGVLLRYRSAAAAGLAAGLCYGLGDVLSKALLVALPSHAGGGALAASPYLYVTGAAHLAGFVLLQRAFQRGGPVAVVAPMTAATNLLPMIAGVLVLGDPLPTSVAATALRLAAFAAAVCGAYLLSGERARHQPVDQAAASAQLEPAGLPA